jgi:hypothetical protein
MIVLDAFIDNSALIEEAGFVDHIYINNDTVLGVAATAVPAATSTPLLQTGYGLVGTNLTTLVENATGVVGNYSWNRATNTYNFSDKILTPNINGSLVNITAFNLSYSVAATTFNSSLLALIPISETWIAVIIIVAISTLILGLIISSFRRN